MTKPWDRFECEIKDLYIKQRKSLHDVQRILYERHGFQASTRAFKMKFEEWGYRKYKTTSRRRTLNPSPPSSDTEEARVESPPQVQTLLIEPPSPRSETGDNESASDVWPVSFPATNPSVDVPQRHTGLLEAVNLRRLGSVIELLSEGASPTDRDCLGNTPLHYASSTSDKCDDDPVGFYIAKALLDCGADPLAQNNKGCTPLHYWATSANMLQYALLDCSTIDVQNTEGDTPLHWAIRWSCSIGQPTVDAVSILIEAGADVDVPDQHGVTAFHLAVSSSCRGWYGTPSDIALFVERTKHLNGEHLWALQQCPGFDSLLRSPTGIKTWTALVRCFIGYDIVPGTLGPAGIQLVYLYLLKVTEWPVGWFSKPMQDLLSRLLAKVDIELSESSGSPVLHQIAYSLPLDSASSAFMSTAIESLLERKACPNGRNKLGATPLMILLQRGPNQTLGYFTAVQALLAGGADPLLPCDDGDRPLYLAMKTCHKSSVRETVIRSCLTASKMSGPSLLAASTLSDSNWWAEWAKEFGYGNWRKALNLLKKMPDYVPLSAEYMLELQRIAATMVARESVQTFKHLYKLDSRRSSEHYPQIAVLEKKIKRIVRHAQVYGATIDQEWMDVTRSLPWYEVSETATPHDWDLVSTVDPIQ